MNGHRSLRRNASWALAGNATYAGSQGVMLVMLARIGSVELVGQFALALAIAGPLFLFAALQLVAVQSTDVRARFSFADYLATRVLMSCGIFAALAAFSLLGPLPRDNAVVLFMVALAKLLETWSQIYFGIFHRYERLDLTAISQILKSVGSLSAFAVALVLTGSLPVALGGMAATWAVLLVAFDAPNGMAILRANGLTAPSPFSALRTAATAENRGRIRTLVGLAAPLGVYALLDSFNAHLPRYVLHYFHGDASVGYYSALVALIVVGATVIDAVGASGRPRLAIYLHENFVAFQRLLRRMLWMGIAVGISGVVGAALLGKMVLSLLYGGGYANHDTALLVLAVGGGLWFVSSIYLQALLAAGRFRTQLAVIVCAVAATWMASAWLVPVYGIIGGAWGLTLGMGVRCVLCGGAVEVIIRRAAPPGVLAPS
jgi:O-antigen/teichoic acid export membrane protein